MTTRVIVPVKNQWEHTRRLLLSLDAAEVNGVLVLDNGSTDITPTAIRSWQRQNYRGIGSKIKRTSMPDATIYQMWNDGFAWAARGAGPSYSAGQRGHRYVLVTNNDIELPPGALAALRYPLETDPDVWVSYPDYDAPWADTVGPGGFSADRWRETRGVLSDGGMLGACFMLAAHRIPWRPLITDLSYSWWWGDNHLAECIEQEGGTQVRVVGLPVKHVNEGTARHDDQNELYLKKLRDRGLWVTRESRGVRAVDRRGTI